MTHSASQEANYLVSLNAPPKPPSSMLIQILGQWEFVKKGAPPIVGITKLDGITLEELKRPRRKVIAEEVQAVPPPSATPEEARQPLDAP